MEQKNFLLTALCAILLVFSINAKTNKHEGLCNKKTIQLRLSMRKLWEDHIVYTRNFIISAIANLADIDAITQRLLKNQDDIGNATKPYYGSKFGNKLSQLLKIHILIAGYVVEDAIAKDTQKFNEDYVKWQNNANDIAKFLSENNPNWSEEELKDMLYTHLKLTTGEVSSRLQENWQADINFYDKNHDHMLMFSDMLTKGIINQFLK